MQRIRLILGLAAVLALCWWAARPAPDPEPPRLGTDAGGTTHTPRLIGLTAPIEPVEPVEPVAPGGTTPGDEPAAPRWRVVVENDEEDEEEEEDERWALRPERAITGRVWEADGRPAVGVPVNAVPETRSIGPWRNSVTRSDGTFRLPRLDVDRDYRVRTDFGRVGGRKDLLRVYSRVVRAGAKDVELRLVQPAHIRGRTVGMDGKPLGKMVIVARPIEKDPAVEGMSSTRSDPKGNFTLGPLPPGEYRVHARSPDPRVGRTAEILVLAPADNVDLQFEQSLTRKGTLIGADAAHFRFSWIATQPGGTPASANGSVADDGTFEIGPMKELPGSAYFYHRESNRCAVVESLRPGTKPITVTLHEGLPISGRIPNGAGGLVYVTSSAYSFQRVPRVGPDGRFRVKGLPRGSYTLRYFAVGDDKLGPPLSVLAGTEGVLLQKRR